MDGNIQNILILVLVCCSRYTLQSFSRLSLQLDTSGCIRQPTIPPRPIIHSEAIRRRERVVASSMVRNWQHFFPQWSKTMERILSHQRSAISPHGSRGKRSFSRTRVSNFQRQLQLQQQRLQLQLLQQQQRQPRLPFKVQRKEFRQMSADEMAKFVQALQQLKISTDANNNYQSIVNLHAFTLAPAAHFGLSFLPWHRQYLDHFEKRLRNMPSCKTLFVPYWDIALDADLPAPMDSALWSEGLFGSHHGEVTSGLGRNWKINQDCSEIGTILRRNVSGNRDFLISRDKIAENIFPAKSLYELMGRLPQMAVSQFELDHGLVHCDVGGCTNTGSCLGHLGCVPCSSNDPLFWLIHAYVDLLWEEWSQLPGRDNTYPIPGVNGATEDGIGGPEFLRNAPMKPFPNLINNDGLRKGIYTDYNMRPSKIRCRTDADCLSEQHMLFCDRCECFGKITEGGNCDGFKDNACYCPKTGTTPRCNPSKKCECNAYSRLSILSRFRQMFK